MALAKVQDLEISGALTGPVSLNLTGTSNVAGAVTVGGTLTATGATTIGGALTATGAAIIGGALTATGNTIVGGTLTASGNINFPGFNVAGVHEQMPILFNYTMTSVQASASNIALATMFRACTIKDWNISVRNGSTSTGGAFAVTLNRSLAGTGALLPIGTATVAGTGGQANMTVVDAAAGTGTAATVVAGDDIIVTTVAGTALPADSVQFDVYIDYVERLA